ncbi:MAG: GH3 auxin-responsive promoter family protein [Bacteroidales bacterium]|nr:GH3 auxin-responsive promoter family protein [Bacteroidales bacterium]
MNTTKLLSYVFLKRIKEIEKYNTEAEHIQRYVLYKLIDAAKDTLYGIKYNFNNCSSYEKFAQNVPLNTYEELKPYITQMMNGEKNILWNTDIEWFAKSSGTTNDKSKFIPVSNEALEECHYQGGKDAVALYLEMNPDSRFLSGKGLILGGSYQENPHQTDIRFGDLSAVLIQNVSFLINLIRVPNKEVALMSEWESKLEALAKTTVNENITNISGVPSWFLTLIKKILAKEGKTNLLEVWPNLEVFFHGGISFEPYREQYKELIPSDNMHYVETYNASEGFFGVQNSFDEHSMLLMIDLGIFFEFIPMDKFEDEKPPVYPLWEVETGVNYAMVISTNSGLWRYIIGDTVKFTSKDPYKFVITGRTKHYINAFGEELMVSNADKGIYNTCKKTGAIVSEYTAAPTFMEGNKKAHHTWIIEFAKEPDSIDEFADILDKELQNLNSDYEAKRYKGLFLSRLEIIKARPNLFHDWLKEKGKLGGQHKVPRLSNNRQFLEQLLQMM